jgi:hypothetical protein
MYLLPTYYFALVESLPSDLEKKGGSFWVHKGDRFVLYRTTKNVDSILGLRTNSALSCAQKAYHIILELTLKHVCDFLVKVLLLGMTNKGEENLLRRKIVVCKDSKRRE